MCWCRCKRRFRRRVRLPRGWSTPSRRKRPMALPCGHCATTRDAAGCRCSPRWQRPVQTAVPAAAPWQTAPWSRPCSWRWTPRSNSASLDGALLNGLLHAGHTPEGPGAEEAEAGKEAARTGHWAAAAECYQKAAEQGNSAGLSLLGECLYQGRGVPKSAAQARKLWKAAAESGETIALLNLGDDCAARGDNGKALLWYRRARQSAAAVPDIEYTPRVCLRLAQYETRYTSRKKALALAAEAKQAFTILQREHEPDADCWLQEAEQLLYELTHEPPTAPAAYNIESLQLD